MSQDGGMKFEIKFTSILSIFLVWLFIVITSSLFGVDGCTSCDHGPSVRKATHQLIHGKCKPCKSSEARMSESSEIQ